MADLPKSGVSLIVENAAKATRDLNQFTAAMRQEVKVSREVAAASSNTSKFTSALSKDFSNMGRNVLSNIPILGRFSGALGSLGGAGTTAAAGANAAATGSLALGAGMTAALPVIGAAVLVIGAATAGLYAFWKAGERGAQVANQLEAFGNIIGGLADSTSVLRGLQSATRGTISDMELMRLSVAALQGQSAEFRGVLLKNVDGVSNLGKVFDVTTRAARASGQSVEIVRDKFLMGLRLQSKLRLDDIGVTVKAEEANQKYAESIGKTAAALTDAEKKQAFLNEALEQLDRIGAEAPINRVQDALARMSVTFTNIKDRLSLAILPVFAPIAMLVSSIVSAVGTIASYVIPVIATISEVVGTVLTEALDTARVIADALFGDMISGAGNMAAYVVAAFQLTGEAIIAVIRLTGTVIRTAIRLFQTALRSMAGVVRGMFGEVGEGINTDINDLAFNIGKGGAQIIGAFAAGIVSGGTFVLEAVTAIAQIVADFLMGFSPPKKGVLSNIDKGAENVALSWVDGFVKGVTKSFGQVTEFVNNRLGSIASLSREQLEGRLARLDLAIRPFKESLTIIKSDMEAIAGFTDPALKIMERQREKLLKAFGRGEKGLDIEQLRTQDRQIQRIKELRDLGQERVDQSELELAIAQSKQAQERALLGIALDRLGKEQKITAEKEKQAGGGGGGAAAPSGSGEGAGLDLGGGAPDILSNEAIDKARQKIISTIAGVAASGAAGIQAGLADSGFGSALGAFNQQRGALSEQMGRIQEADPAQKIKDKFAGLKDAITAPLEEVKTAVDGIFKAMFGEEGTITGYLNIFTNMITSIFSGDESPITAAKMALAEALQKMGEDFLWLKDQVDEKLGTAKILFESFFTNEDSPVALAKDAVKNLIDDVVNNVLRLTNTGANTLSAALEPLLETLRSAIVVPFQRAAQAMVDSVRTGLSSLLNGLSTLLGVLGINLPTIPSIEVSFPEMAKGTLGINSPFIAGEKGKELIMPSRNNPLSVFPAKATRALTMLANSPLTRPAPMPAYIQPMASQNTNNNSTVNNNGNKNVTINSRQSMSRLEMMQAANSI